MTQRVRAWLLTSLGALAVGGAFFAACSEKPAPSGAADSGFGTGDGSNATDGAASDGASDGSLDASAACNALEMEGTLVGQTSVSGPTPKAAGGEIFPGTYWLTARKVYEDGAPDGVFLQRVIRIEPETKTIQTIEGTASTPTAAPSNIVTATATYQVFDATVLSTKATCPSPEVVNVRFTAGGAELTLFRGDAVTEIYTLQ